MPALVPKPIRAIRNTSVLMPSGKGCSGCRKVSNENDPPPWKKIKKVRMMKAVPTWVMIEIEKSRIAHVGLLMLRHHQEIGQQRHEFPDNQEEEPVVGDHNKRH